MLQDCLNYIQGNGSDIALRIADHMKISLIALFAAILIGVAGVGLYKEEGKPIVKILPGSGAAPAETGHGGAVPILSCLYPSHSPA